MNWSRPSRSLVRMVIASAAMLAALLLTGCATRLTSEDDAQQVNAGLDYLWTEGNAVGVRPGMRLVVHALPLRPKGLNEAPPALMAYDWTVPGPDEAVSRKDLLFASFLAISGMPGAATPPDQAVERQFESELERLRKVLCPGEPCIDQAIVPPYATGVLAPLFSTLRVRYLHGWTPGGARSAEAVRRKACAPSASAVAPTAAAAALDGRSPTDSLVFTWPAGSAKHYEVLGAADWFVRGDRLPAVTMKNGSAWYPQADIGHARAFTELLIPVRLGSAAISTHWPVCSTVADIERRIGQQVVALRRSEVFLPKGKEPFPTPPLLRDGYFTIWLDARPSLQDASATPALKRSLVVGAGDVLILARQRTRPTDAPVPSWSR